MVRLQDAICKAPCVDCGSMSMLGNGGGSFWRLTQILPREEVDMLVRLAQGVKRMFDDKTLSRLTKVYRDSPPPLRQQNLRQAFNDLGIALPLSQQPGEVLTFLRDAKPITPMIQ
jgi:hypothetical protein